MAISAFYPCQYVFDRGYGNYLGLSHLGKFIADALSPAKVRSVILNNDERQATVEVMPDQLSLAIGRGGQNVRLAAKLTGYRIDIRSTEGEEFSSEVKDAKPLSEETPEEEVQEFIASDQAGEPSEETSAKEESTEDKTVVADNTNSEG